MRPHYLDQLIVPGSVAVFGASERVESVGGHVFRNLTRGRFSGPVYALNPKHKKVLGKRCYPDLQTLNRPVDAAVIATPAATVPGIIHACGEHGVGAAIVLSAGFGEQSGGESLRQTMLEEARRYDLRLLGPNCLGLIRPGIGLNATFSNNSARTGSLALVSQSGALCTAILDWAQTHNIGFSVMISLGDAADVDFGDLLDYLALDPETAGILLYVEGVRDARRFMSGLRVAARLKPVVAVKAGRHDEASRAALSHTGSLVGSDDVFAAALQRAGAVRALTIEQLFAAGQLLASRHRVRGNRLAIITNGGGPGVMATDRAADLNVAIAQLAPDTLTRLDAALPSHWSRSNPVDILGDAAPTRYGAAVSACLDDPGIDGALVMLTPQAMTDPTASVQAVIDAARDKPLLACWMGDRQVARARALFAEHNIPAFASPERSVEAFSFLSNYRINQQLLLQVPAPLARTSEADVDGARMIIDGALAEHRSTLTSAESRAVMHAFGIPVIPLIEAHSANDALIAAETMGFPVAMKINSPDISHKSEVDGIRLNIANAEHVRSSYTELIETVQRQRPDVSGLGVTVEPMYRGRHGRELLVGVIRDPVFGPVISFGAGGTTVEILRDRAVALPPLNSFIADNLIGQTRVAKLLDSFRNLPPADIDAVKQVLRRVSEIVCELPQIRELEINPLMSDETGAVAIDARIFVSHLSEGPQRYAHMAIHPYPSHLVNRWQLPDGTDLTIRPIRPEDGEIEQTFVRNLSVQSKYFRFMQSLRELTPEMLVRFTQIDYDRELALVAVIDDGGEETEIGVARYAIGPDGRSCEFALVVADPWQGKGIGSRLMSCLMAAARARGLDTMEGEVLAENAQMLALVRTLGFDVRTSDEDASVKQVTKRL